jgi:hypothetical protein
MENGFESVSWKNLLYSFVFLDSETLEKFSTWRTHLSPSMLSAGPNELYTTSIEALYTIMGAKGWPKGPSYDSGITKGDLGGDSVLTIKTC